MRRLPILLLISAFAAATLAAGLSPAARTEVDALLSRLEASGCQFSRNGSWYSSAEARSHLLRKLTYLEDRGAVRSAEQFIELAASGSSVSGQPYLVRCGSGDPVRSGTWLRSQLQAIRSPAESKRTP
jgi:hypothetical protein